MANRTDTMTSEYSETVTSDNRKNQLLHTDSLVWQSSNLICMAGFDGFFKRLTPAWETTFGHPVKDLLSKSYLSFIHPDDRTPTMSDIRQLNETCTHRFQCADEHTDVLKGTMR